MQTRFLLLAPVLVSIAGCSEKIEAHENESEPSEIRMPPVREEEVVVEDDEANASEEHETDLKPLSPAGLD